MRLLVKRCRTCGVLGIGPNAPKLWPLNNYLYCERGDPKNPGCYRQALEWDDKRSQVVQGLKSVKEFHEDIKRPKLTKKHRDPDWRGYIQELAGMAGWALEIGDRRTFVHYFSRAILAWGMHEVQRSKTHG